MTRATVSGRWQPAAIGAAILILLVAVFSVAPVREAAAQFLDVFRVRKFAVIPVDPAKVEQLENLSDQIDAGILGEPTVLREAGQPQHVTSAEEADAVAGFDVRVPAALPDEMTLQQFTVTSGPGKRLDVSRDTLQALAAVAGVDDVPLPDAETVSIEVDIPMVVEQRYDSSRASVKLVQLPSPSVTIPEGIDPTAYGEVLLRLLGVPAADAQRLAATIDWTSTLIIPFPTDVGSFREVSVNGASGVLLEQERGRYSQRHKMLLWQQNDVVFALTGSNVDASELVRIAESLQ